MILRLSLVIKTIADGYSILFPLYAETPFTQYINDKIRCLDDIYAKNDDLIKSVQDK